jgi:competence protein ComEC
VDNGDPNNTSIVLRIVYGDTSFLFTGDAEREVEQAILNSGTEISSTVLKVGHHGSESSTSYVWLREIMPKYAVISVGDDNSYGHPTEEVLSRLRYAEVKTYRTDLQGDIICVSDGKNVTFTVERNEDADVFGDIGKNSTEATTETTTAPTEPVTEATEDVEDNGQDYVANKNTKKFHYPSCSSADDIKASNRWDFYGTRDELIDMGYVPCKRCNP